MNSLEIHMGNPQPHWKNLIILQKTDVQQYGDQSPIKNMCTVGEYFFKRNIQ